jgi:hypothetical protein
MAKSLKSMSRMRRNATKSRALSLSFHQVSVDMWPIELHHTPSTSRTQIRNARLLNRILSQFNVRFRHGSTMAHNSFWQRLGALILFPV